MRYCGESNTGARQGTGEHIKPISPAAHALFTIAGGRITCTQCQARSKRTGQQCRAPAAKGKTKCRFHGGASSGARTPEGKQRSAAAKTVHGRETRSKRRERSLASVRLAQWEALGYALGMMAGPRTSGRKPALLSKASSLQKK